MFDVLLDVLALVLDGVSLAATRGESNSAWWMMFSAALTVATVIGLLIAVAALALG